MNEELIKSLTDLIDETLHELDELKKSSKYSATEIDMKGPGENLNEKNEGSDKDVNGALAKEEEKVEEKKEFPAAPAPEAKEEPKEEKKDEDEDEKKKKEKKDGEKPAFFAKEEECKTEPCAESKSEEKEEKKEEPKAEKKEDSDKDSYFKLFKKSEQEVTDLMKSLVDSRISPIEQKLETVLDLVNKMASQPNPAKGVSARDVVPLKKSEEETPALSKEAIGDKLFALKKSGAMVATEDFVKIDLGQDLENIVKKYNLK